MPKELSRIKRARASTSEEGIDNGSTLVRQRIGKERELTRCNLETVKWLEAIAGFKDFGCRKGKEENATAWWLFKRQGSQCPR